MRAAAAAAACLWCVAALGQPAVFDFSRTLRIDYLHGGGPGGESVTLDGLVLEGEWAGSRTRLVEDGALGKYLVEIVEGATGSVLYSQGFASVFGEWETTPEARSARRTFHESVRAPYPNVPARVVLKKRDHLGIFVEIWRAELEPQLMRAAAPVSGVVSAIAVPGPPVSKVDLLILSEGYSAGEMGRFRADARRLVEAVFAREPFRSRRDDFNVRLLELPDASVSVRFNIFGLQRYALADDNRALRNAAAAAPYDIVAVLFDDSRYGGGGVFNQQSVVAAGNAAAEYVFIHELAHNLAGLGDEYVGAVTYQTGAPIATEPWEPNITALLDPASLKWRDLVEPGTPLPTPPDYAGKVGAFQGAGYEARGLFRPEVECIMGSRTFMEFCRVCRRAIDRAIDRHTR